MQVGQLAPERVGRPRDPPPGAAQAPLQRVRAPARAFRQPAAERFGAAPQFAEAAGEPFRRRCPALRSPPLSRCASVGEPCGAAVEALAARVELARPPLRAAAWSRSRREFFPVGREDRGQDRRPRGRRRRARGRRSPGLPAGRRAAGARRGPGR